MLTGIKVDVIYTDEYIAEEPDAVIPQVWICVGSA
jgi:hypothetical protein